MGRPKKYSTLEEAYEANKERSKKKIEENYDEHLKKQREKQREIYRKKHPNAKTYKKHIKNDPQEILNAPVIDINNLELPKNVNESSINIQK
jgi:hypothetical protein